MALWDSGVWDTAKWSTIEATISVTLGDITFAGAGQDVHVATIAFTLGDIGVTSSGTVTHNGTLALTTGDISTSISGYVTRHATLALTLDDFIVSMGGQDIHVGNISVTLDDATFVSSGNITKHADISIALDDATFYATGKHIEVDDFRLQLDDITVNIDAYIVQTFLPTKGGYKPKQKKVKNERAEVEKAVEQALNKALGIVETEDIVEQVEEVKAPEIDYTAQINELMLEAQAKALGISIEQYLIDSELDDEETILLFI